MRAFRIFWRAAAAAFLLAFPAAAGDISDRDLESWVEKRIAEVQPTPEEKRIDEIAWAEGIRQAERLSKESKRPVFLFTHDGRINTGRC